MYMISVIWAEISVLAKLKGWLYDRALELSVLAELNSWVYDLMNEISFWDLMFA